jgi:hypothetical protein
MAASAPTFVGGHQIGVSSVSSSNTPGKHSPADTANEDRPGGGTERSFFEQERDKLVEEIAGVRTFSFRFNRFPQCLYLPMVS